MSSLAAPALNEDDAEDSAAETAASGVTPPAADATADAGDASQEIDPWSGSAALGATVRTGNTDNPGVSGEATLRYIEDRWHHRGKVAGDYLRNRTETQEQFIEGEFETRYDLDSRIFTCGFARYEDDRFSGYDYEFLSLAGLGRHLILEEGHEWTVTLGPSYRVAAPSDSESQQREVGARFTNLLSWGLSHSATVQNETEAQGDRERLRVNNDVGLKVRLVDQLSAQLSFGVEYRSDAPDDSEHTDTTTRAAVVYDF